MTIKLKPETKETSTMDKNAEATPVALSHEVRHATERGLDLITRLLGARRDHTNKEEPPGALAAIVTPPVDIGTPAQLRILAASAPERLQDETQKLHDEEKLRDRQRVNTLLQTHLRDSIWNELLSHVRPAAEHGESEFLLIRFPSDLCTDGGRKIRIGEDGWRDTLQGEVAELRDRWQRDLSGEGFGLAASTLEYHEDMPGDIGLFLTWHG